MRQALKSALDAVLRLQSQFLLVRLGIIIIIMSAFLLIASNADLFSRDSPLYLCAMLPVAILVMLANLYFWAGVHVFFCETLVKRKPVPVLGVRGLTPHARSLFVIGLIIAVLSAAIGLACQFLIQQAIRLLPGHIAGIVRNQLPVKCIALAIFRGVSLFCVAAMFVRRCGAMHAIMKGLRFLRAHFAGAIPVFVLVLCSACVGQYVSYLKGAAGTVPIALGLSMPVVTMAFDLLAAASCYLVIRKVRDERMTPQAQR